MSVRQEIDTFLRERRIAMVGVSTDPKHFSRGLFRDLQARGYEMIPVNPKSAEIAGQRCYASLREIQPAPAAVLIMTPASQTDTIVRDCLVAGVTRVWMHRAAGPGAVSGTALRFCHDNGLHVIAGECPYMFLPDAGFPHNVHGWIRKSFHAELRA
jgi:predicted CoA-binding protein